jgi:dsDNA-specific endonuclease/ATPase MutS2
VENNLSTEDEQNFRIAEPVVVRPDGTLDLHSFSAKDVPSLLDEFIRLSRRDGMKLVKIIHGKGSGSLRHWVHRLLDVDPGVARYYDASPGSGGWGATVVELMPRQEGENDGSSG